MSYRDRYSRTTGLSGYRSQPVSNRSSLYLSNDYSTTTTTNYNSDLSDFDRQFKKLLERTEKFTSRVEKLQSTSTYIKKGFRRLDNTVTGIRSQRDYIESAFDNIENRLDDRSEPPTTEEEWRRFFEEGILIEKAVELMRSRYRYPKPVFEYSPEGCSPHTYDMSSNTSLVSMPESPPDAEGNRIRDLGSQVKNGEVDNNSTNNRTKESNKRITKENKQLPIVSEVEEQNNVAESPNKPSTFTSSKVFDNENTNGKINDSEDTLTRKPSFLRTLISNKKKTRPVSMIEKPSSTYRDENVVNEVNTKMENQVKASTMNSIARTDSYSQRSQLTKSKSMFSDDEKEGLEDPLFQRQSSQSSSKRNSDIFRENKTPSSPTKKRGGGSSSFHEYNPSNRIPLKERLRMKREAEAIGDKPEEKGTESVPQQIKTNSDLAQRASRILNKSKEKEKDKEESTSLKSRFLRRFRHSKNDNADQEEEKGRRKTRPLQNENNQPEADTPERKKSQDSLRKRSRKNSSSKDENKTSSRNSTSSSKSSRHTSTSKDKEEQETAQRKRRNRKSRPLSDDVCDVFEEPRRFADITASLRDMKKPEIIASKPGKEEENDIRLSGQNDSNLSPNLQLDAPTMYTKQEVTTPVVLRRKKVDGNAAKQPENKTLLDTENLKNLNRKSVLIFEEDIVPVMKTQTIKQVDFRSPQRSLEEISEEELSTSIVESPKISDDIFDVLTSQQRQVSEEDIPVVQITSENIVDTIDLERVYQNIPTKEISFDEDVNVVPQAVIKTPNVTTENNLSKNDDMNIIPEAVKTENKINNSNETEENKSKDLFSSSSFKDTKTITTEEVPKTVSKPKFGRPTLPSLTANSILRIEDEKKQEETTPKSAPVDASQNSNYFEYNTPDRPTSSILNSDDVAFRTFAKYSGRKAAEISGKSIDVVDDTKDEIETNIDTVEPVVDVENHLTPTSKSERISPLSLRLENISVKTTTASGRNSTSPTINTPKQPLKLKKTSLKSLTKMPSLDSLSFSTKTPLNNRDKREAHMNLLKTQQSFSGSLSSLTETSTKRNSLNISLKGQLANDLYMTKGELRRFSLDEGPSKLIDTEQDPETVKIDSEQNEHKNFEEVKAVVNELIEQSISEVSKTDKKYVIENGTLNFETGTSITSEDIKLIDNTKSDEINNEVSSMDVIENDENCDIPNVVFQTEAEENNGDVFLSPNQLNSMITNEEQLNGTLTSVNVTLYNDNETSDIGLVESPVLSSERIQKQSDSSSEQKQSTPLSTYNIAKRRSSESNLYRSPPERYRFSRAKSVGSEIRPQLEKQMSIREYRRRKLERAQTSSSFSDESVAETSDLDHTRVSSLADCSDLSDDDRRRNKRFLHKRKTQIQQEEKTSESSSESDINTHSYQNKTIEKEKMVNGDNETSSQKTIENNGESSLNNEASNQKTINNIEMNNGVSSSNKELSDQKTINNNTPETKDVDQQFNQQNGHTSLNSYNVKLTELSMVNNRRMSSGETMLPSDRRRKNLKHFSSKSVDYF